MEQTNQTLQAELLFRAFSTDLTAEFVLPDYQPEIKRLLRVRAVPLPVEQYLGGSAAELSGAVEFQALYAAEDGSLWCVTRREDYRLSCPFEASGDFDLSNGLVCDVKTAVDGVSGRVSAPRKLSARCRVNTSVRLFADRTVAPDLPEDAETLPGTLSASRVRIGKSEPFTLTDEIPLDPTEAPVRVISAFGEVFPTEVQAATDSVACRGEIMLSLLCAPEATPSPEGAEDCIPAAVTPTELRRKIPFAVEIPVEGATPACAATAWGSCPEITVTVEENRILCDVTAVVCARAVCREEVPFIQNAYSATRVTEPAFASLPAVQILACKNGNCSLSATKDLAELGLRPGAQVIDATAELSIQPPELARGNYLLPGNLHLRVLAKQPDGDNSTAELDLPFRYESNAEGTTEPTASDSVVTPVLVRAWVDGNRLFAEVELAVSLILSATLPVTALAALREGDAVPERTADMTICYPAPDDTLWSVAARYHTPVAELQKKNDLPDGAPDAPGSLGGVRYLVI